MDNNQPVVNAEVTAAAGDGVNAQVPGVVAGEQQPPAPQPGSKTDPNLLLKSLQEERDKRKALEERIQILENPNPTEDDVVSDEGKILRGQISKISEELTSLKEERELDRIYAQYPTLRDKASEFIEFRKAEHPRAKMESVAKLFLAEKGLLEPTRKGLERPTGGDKTPAPTGLTTDEVTSLRKTNYRKYEELVKKGIIDPTKIR